MMKITLKTRSGTRNGFYPTRNTAGCRRRGISTVEAALVLPLIVLLTFGAIQFGTLFYVRSNMLHAARETARALAVRGQTQHTAQDLALELLTDMNITFNVETEVPQGFSDTNRNVTVRISTLMKDAALGDVFHLMGDKQMTVEVSMRLED